MVQIGSVEHVERHMRRKRPFLAIVSLHAYVCQFLTYVANILDTIELAGDLTHAAISSGKGTKLFN